MRFVDHAEWRGAPGALVRMVRWLALSAVLHIPVTPLAALLGLALLLVPREDEAHLNVPPITEIPIELLPETEAPEPAPPAFPAPEAAPAAAAAPARPKEVIDRSIADAGVPPDASADAAADAAVPDAGAPDASAQADAGLDAGAPDAATDAGAPDAGDAGVVERRPLAVAGGRGVVDPNANVKVLIDTQRLRGHPLGARIGKMLGSVYQWRDFFGPTGIDPVKDTDRIFITGPQLRDSSGVVALIQHRLEPQRLRAAIDLLVQRDRDGEWLDAGVPAARARADRAQRFFVMPSANLLVVTPESALKSAQRLGPKTRLPPMPPPDVLTAHVETPWRVFIGTGLAIPRSLTWAEARIAPEEDGGATVRFLAEDADEASASRSAAQLQRAVSDGLDLLASTSNIFSLLFGGKTPPLVQTISFRAEGKRVVGAMTFTASQVTRILDLGGRLLVPPSARRQAPGTGGAAAQERQPPPAPTRP